MSNAEPMTSSHEHVASDDATSAMNRVVRGRTGRERLVVAVLRSTVTGLVATVALAGEILDRLSGAERLAASISLWILWGASLLCILVPASSSLTAVRLVLPSHLATLTVVALGGGVDTRLAVALAVSSMATVVAMSAETGAYFIQSSAYGDERRFPLRSPRPFLVVMVVAWALWFAVAACGVILLLAGSIVGIVPSVIGLAGFAVLPRRFHRSARRWLVAVPAGLVIHDHLVLAETAMFARRSIVAVEPWPSDDASQDEPMDLSGGVKGSGVIIRLTDSETVILAPTKDHPGGRAFHVRSMRVCPTRIGRTMRLLNNKK